MSMNYMYINILEIETGLLKEAIKETTWYNDIIANLWCECVVWINQGLSDYINQDTIQQSIKKIKLLDKIG